jgi:hypothetical protein
MQKSEVVLLEYDPEAAGAGVSGVLQLIDVPWQQWASMISNLKTKDVLLLGVGAWILHNCLFAKRSQRISGRSLENTR